MSDYQTRQTANNTERTNTLLEILIDQNKEIIKLLKEETYKPGELKL